MASTSASTHTTLPPELHALVQTATDILSTLPASDPPRLTDHTVASAALAADGRIFTGINMFHFAGGPCAENVAVGNAVAGGISSMYSPPSPSAPKVLLEAIVAVASQGRGVISPCGRCRQLLMDYWPGIKVVVQDEDGTLRCLEIRELLPFAYVPKAFTRKDTVVG
ncbi:hypothetical protein BP6252_10345 [Coleophoma cylindrospora]|uniref:CMP/dCMP-type deaminase domain-containing protein n=1 Tax=Coleophoma cylindrospora TaxID=1849047 RepID=A0A3D8QT56_9HELO|nr:hypothetical protein BP6252_10345 [Coleophoma cylindrospora]